jgi:hypothetical protein
LTNQLGRKIKNWEGRSKKRADSEKYNKEAKVRNRLNCHLRRRRRRRRKRRRR